MNQYNPHVAQWVDQICKGYHHHRHRRRHRRRRRYRRSVSAPSHRPLHPSRCGLENMLTTDSIDLQIHAIRLDTRLSQRVVPPSNAVSVSVSVSLASLMGSIVDEADLFFFLLSSSVSFFFFRICFSLPVQFFTSEK